jgi:hypothetical protein
MEKDQDTVEIELNGSEPSPIPKRRVPGSPTVSKPSSRKNKSAISTVTNLFVLIALFSAVLALQYISNQSGQETKDNEQPAKEVVQGVKKTEVEKTEVVITEVKKVTPTETDKTTIVDLTSLETVTPKEKVKPSYAPKVKPRARRRVTRRRDIAREDKIMSEKLVNQLDGSYARRQPRYSTAPVASSYDTPTSSTPVASSYENPTTSYVDDLDGQSARENYIATNRVKTTSYSSGTTSTGTTSAPKSKPLPSGSSSYESYGYGSTKRVGIRPRPSYNRWEN